MLKAYTYIKSEEIKDYKTLLEATDGLFITDQYGLYAIDQSVLLARTEEQSMERLARVRAEGKRVYARKKVYRQPVFDIEADIALDNWLYQFAYEYSESEFDREELMEKKLLELKKIIGDYYVLLEK